MVSGLEIEREMEGSCVEYDAFMPGTPRGGSSPRRHARFGASNIGSARCLASKGVWVGLGLACYLFMSSVRTNSDERIYSGVISRAYQICIERLYQTGLGDRG